VLLKALKSLLLVLIMKLVNYMLWATDRGRHSKSRLPIRYQSSIVRTLVLSH